MLTPDDSLTRFRTGRLGDSLLVSWRVFLLDLERGYANDGDTLRLVDAVFSGSFLRDDSLFHVSFDCFFDCLNEAIFAIFLRCLVPVDISLLAFSLPFSRNNTC